MPDGNSIAIDCLVYIRVLQHRPDGWGAYKDYRGRPSCAILMDLYRIYGKDETNTCMDMLFSYKRYK